MASSDAGPSDQHGEGMDMDGWWRKNTRQVAKRFLGEGSGSLPFCFGGKESNGGRAGSFGRHLKVRVMLENEGFVI